MHQRTSSQLLVYLDFGLLINSDRRILVALLLSIPFVHLQHHSKSGCPYNQI